MKNAVSIFFVILLLSAQTPLGQLLKVPLLIEHYLKHQRAEVVSFAAFLKEHYDPDHNDADMPEDEQLPFKDIAVQSIGYALFASDLTTNVFVPSPVEKVIVFSDANPPRNYLDSIFHPPRI